jgi:hypothetical protein
LLYSNPIRLGGLVTMVGSVVFALVVIATSPPLVSLWQMPRVAEASTLPTFLLLLVVVSVAILAIMALLRGTHDGGLGVLACGVSLVGVVLVFGASSWVFWESLSFH